MPSVINTTKPMFDPSGALPNQGKGVIQLLDAQNGKGDNLFFVTSSSPTSWNAFPNAVSAAHYAGLVFDYYKTRHGRNSIDDKGMSMLLVVNFDNKFNNAFWNGQFMIFGNGDGQVFTDLAGSLDVTAHEMSHGVIEHTANLVYEFQSGALNESFADVFGVSTDFFVNGNNANWLLGEDVTTPGTAGDALRDMEHPDGANVALNGQQPAHMDDFRNLTSDQDNGGVHINSGIPNRAYFLTADAIGITDAEQIWYRALSQHLVRNSQFVDLRIATIRSAEELFGAGSAQVQAVTSAMDAVGIVGDGGTQPPPPLPDNQGDDFIAVTDVDSGHVFRVDPGFNAATDISGIDATVEGRPSFSDDGRVMTWVSSDQNIYISFSDGTNRQQLSSDGNFSGVALSPDGSHLAVNSIFEDGTIFVFDLLDAAGDRGYQLTSQNSTSGEVPDAVVGADVMEFSVDGGFLIYDALNRTELSGFTYEYWDINLLRLADGKTFRVFQPLPEGQNIGNPTFAQNSDNRIAFDFMDEDGNVSVLAYDFQSNTVGTITNNFSTLGRPAFSGDDRQVYYQFPVDVDGSSVDGIWVVSLDADGLNGVGDDAAWAQFARSPVWFTVGSRPTPVRLLSFNGTWTGGAVHLEWNVVDAQELAGFLLERSASPETGFVRRGDGLIPVVGAEPSGEVYRFEDPAPGAPGARFTYRLTGLARDGSVNVLGTTSVAFAAASPVLPVLLPASPNPFTGSTLLRVRVPAGAEGRAARLGIYDVRGRLVARPLDAPGLPAGDVEVAWDGRGTDGAPVAAGTYLVRLETGGTVSTGKVIRLP